jgi:hypothetical protein
MITWGFGVAVGAGVRACVVEGGGANSAFLGAGASLPVMSESLAFAALVGGSCREVFRSFPVLSKDCDAVFEVDFGFLLVFQGDNA